MDADVRQGVGPESDRETVEETAADLDAVVADMHAALEVCSRLVSREEYEALAGDFGAAVDPVRVVREALDEARSVVATDPATVAELVAQMRSLQQELVELRSGLREVAGRLREAASAPQVCAALADEVVAGIATFETAGASAGAGSAAAQARAALAGAHALSVERRWLAAIAALRATVAVLPSAGAATVAPAAAGAVMDAAGVVRELEVSLDLLRARGSQAAQLFEAMAARSAADAAPHRARIEAAGRLFADVRAAVATSGLAAQPSDAARLSRLHQEVTGVLGDLDHFVAFAQEWLATA